IDSPQVYFSADAGYYPTLLTPTMPAPERFTGALFVLVDGDCFSTTGHLCSLLRYHGIGRFVGEETGGSFSTTANTTDLLLPRTRLRLRLARNTFTTAVSGLERARGVFPHDVILPDAHDIITGTDP